MRGYERNYDFGDLLDCVSGLNHLAALEYGKEAVKLSKAHVKQRPLRAKLHPLLPGHAKPDLFDFARLAIDDHITKALKVGLQEAQSLFTQLNMSPHARDTPKGIGVPSTMEANVDVEEDETNDLEVYGHEARHVMSETMSTLLMEHAPTKRKVDPMVSYEGHQMYKPSLVNFLLGNPILSKDHLTCIKQSVYFNGMKPKQRVDGVPVCIIDVGSDCAMLFDGSNNLFSISSQGLPTR
ncbi:hypothetical protein R1flu_021598 [Riccia fluitans]|uniref:Uncharacterized protein n=1 Tax=Riccia fluitans TaxID=41844 RepID=A0ABD1ZQ78_9MARC